MQRQIHCRLTRASVASFIEGKKGTQEPVFALLERLNHFLSFWSKRVCVCVSKLICILSLALRSSLASLNESPRERERGTEMSAYV